MKSRFVFGWIVLSWTLFSGNLFGVVGEPKADNDQEPEGKVIEIRQGGYVEKVDPLVDYKNRLPHTPPKKPSGSLLAIHSIPGFQLECVASEPLVRDAVDLAFDENGGLYVAEIIPYAEGNSSQQGSPNGRISLLHDKDGDGNYDTSRVFVDKLIWPSGIACYDGGLYIAATPDILYCKDTDGDGQADLREVVLTGFDAVSPNAMPNSLRWGLDHRIHGMTSSAGGIIQAVQWNRNHPEDHLKAVQARGRDFSIDPRSGQFELESGGAQFGMTFDIWGNKFESTNNKPIEMIMVEDRYLARNPYLATPSPRMPIWVDGEIVYPTSPVEPWRAVRTEMRVRGNFSGPVEGGGTASGYFTAACGLMIYQGDAWPETYHNSALVCEAAGNLIHRMRLQPNGIGFTAHRTETKHEFVTSDEIWFRPIQLANAPDGTLYVADMYREIIEHPDAIPPSAKKYLNLSHGNDRGRVYRIVPEGFKQPPLPRLGALTSSELVALLAHTNGWHRNTASRLLFERQDLATITPLRTLASDSPSPLGRMHALHLLAGLGALDEAILLARLEDTHPRVREHTVRLAESKLADSPKIRSALVSMVQDEDPRVRYQLAFTVGNIPGDLATATLATIAVHDAADRWVRLAILSSSLNRAGSLLSAMTNHQPWRTSPHGLEMLEQLARQAGLQNQSAQIAKALQVLATLPATEKALAEHIVNGLSQGLKQSGGKLPSNIGSAGIAQEILAGMLAQAKQIAIDLEQPLDQRIEAIRSLGLASYQEAAELLPELLVSNQPKQVQIAALSTLGQYQNQQVGPTIVEAWPSFSPQIRTAAIEALFARPERLTCLMDAIDAKQIHPSDLGQARIEFLLAYPEISIRNRAKTVLGRIEHPRREDVVKAYREVLTMHGDRERGKGVFKKECSICHQLEGIGFDLGLPLATVKSRGSEGILTQILDPNREVNPAYMNYVILTEEGRALSGMIRAETATSITLMRGQDQSDTVLRKNIDEMQSTGQSIMPAGLEKQIGKQSMADLIEYLMTIP
jgi:putative membrane-bound dehydrogenase-like protein